MDAILFILLVYVVPVVAALAGAVAARSWGRRWYLPAVGLAVAAVVVIVGASAWYGSGCGDSDTCERSIGIAIEAIWLVIAAALCLLLGLAFLHRYRRS